MEESKSIQQPLSTTWLNRLGWGFIILLMATFLILVAFKYFIFTEEVYERFWAIRWWVLGHVVTGSVALILGPFQFWKNFRTRNIRIHRILGKTYLVSILIGSICAFVLAGTSALAISWQWATSLGMLGVAWVVTSSMAYFTIRQKRIDQHKEWMIRSYIVTFAFITFRVLVALGMIAGLGDFPDVAPSALWMSWTIPLLIGEVCLQWKK